MAISQGDFEKVVNKVLQGGPSPAYKQLRGGLPELVTFSGEEIRWIGQVTTDESVFGGGQYATYSTHVGVSRYRAVLFTNDYGESLCQSFWFEVDFEGLIYETGKLRKRTYKRLGFARPEFDRGVVSQVIILARRATRVYGKEDKLFQCRFEGIKWRNPQTGKYERRKAQLFYNQLVQAYDSRIPVPVSALWFLAYKPREAPTIALPGKAAVAPEVQPAARAESPAQTPRPGAPTAGAACPNCGAPLRAGAVVCGKCGTRLGEPTAGAADTCPGCGLPIEDDWRACPSCGEKLIFDCPECGEQVKRHWKLCRFCQAELHLTEREPEMVQDSAQLCPKCGEPVQPDWRICPACATPLSLKCPACGEDVEPDWKSCPFCEADLSE